MMPSREFVAIDLFCGAGGMSYGLKQAGIKVICGVDTDSRCQYPYDANIGEGVFRQAHLTPDTQAGQIVPDSWIDIDLESQWYKARCRILAASPPCQEFSSIGPGKNKGRYALISGVVRLARMLSPDYLIIENVRQSARDAVYRTALSDLRALGYAVVSRVEDAADHGVAQHRFRSITIASLRGNPATVDCFHGSDLGMSVRDAIGDLPPVEAGKVHPSDPLHSAARLNPRNLARVRASQPGGTWRDWPEDLWLDCHKRKEGIRFVGVYGRMSWDSQAPTITTNFFNLGSGRFGHPEQDRALTLREGPGCKAFQIVSVG